MNLIFTKLFQFCTLNLNYRVASSVRKFHQRQQPSGFSFVEKSCFTLSPKIMSEPESVESDVKDFELIFDVKANGVHPVYKYRSKSTGLEVVLANVEGPIVNGYIVLATKAKDDNGLPHTLEHLIFLGSEEYPFKGILDVLANKCLASGTNAWTDVDHTCYTVTTAGSEGFCTLLPIYLDHVFFPLLRDEGFCTEVYHFNGEGRDAGVVYSEIQACENTAEERATTALTRSIYPTSSGYHYQYGGVLKNLRETCDNVQVKKYHDQFYHPANACVIVCGMVKAEEIFKALAPIVKKLKERSKCVCDWKKPWLEDVEEISAPIEKTVAFPSEDEEEANVTIGFRGPSAILDVETIAALRLLFEYLSDSTVGPLQLEFVENDNPLANQVSYAEMENSRTTFYIEFEGVPIEDMGKIGPKLKEVLKSQIENFNSSRIIDIIKKQYQEELSSMENTPHNSIAYAVIGDFLYGNDEKEIFIKRVSCADKIKQFLEQPPSFWTSLIQTGILDQKWVTIYAKPSKKEFERLAKEEKLRVEERMERLGEDGLMFYAKKLEDCVNINNVSIPMETLQNVTTPSINSIGYHKITRLENPDWASDIKCKVMLDDIKTSFVYVSFHMDTSDLSVEQKKYLPVLKDALSENPIVEDDGTILSFEDVVAGMSRDLLEHSIGLGIDSSGRFKCGSFSHILAFNCQIELEKLEAGFDWIRKVFWKTQWSSERLKVLASKMVTEVNQLKRGGNRMASVVLKDLLYTKESNTKSVSLIRQQKFLKEFIKDLPTSENKVKKILDAIMKNLLQPKNCSIHMAASVDKLNDHLAKKPEKIDLQGLFKKSFTFAEDLPLCKRIANDYDVKWIKDSTLLKNEPKQVILGIGSEESSYLTQALPSLTDPMDPEVPALLTVIQYFCQTEGPFYRNVRGGGYAYDFYMDLITTSGMLFFNLFQCSDVVGAYKVAKETITDHLNGKEPWNEDLLISAKNSLIFEIITSEKTPLALASSSLCYYYRNVPATYAKTLISSITDLKLSDLKPIAEKYFCPMFNESVNCAVVCPNDKVSAISEGLNKLGKKLTMMPTMANSFLAEWEK